MRQFLAILAMAVAAFISGCTADSTLDVSLEDRATGVIEGLQVFKAGDGPAPTIIFLHGASDRAWHQEYERWVRRMNAAGFSVVHVDMYKHRGKSGSDARSGRFLPREAAGDLMVTLDWVKGRAWSDNARIHALGSSFGGAVIMDAMVHGAPGGEVPGYANVPAGRLDGLASAVLLNPLCRKDIGSVRIVSAVSQDFAVSVPLLAVLAENDRVSDPALCRDIMRRNSARGVPVEIHSVAGAGHDFMASTDDYGQPMADYNATAAEAAWQKVFAFLGR